MRPKTRFVNRISGRDCQLFWVSEQPDGSLNIGIPDQVYDNKTSFHKFSFHNTKLQNYCTVMETLCHDGIERRVTLKVCMDYYNSAVVVNTKRVSSLESTNSNYRPKANDQIVVIHNYNKEFLSCIFSIVVSKSGFSLPRCDWISATSVDLTLYRVTALVNYVLVPPISPSQSVSLITSLPSFSRDQAFSQLQDPVGSYAEDIVPQHMTSVDMLRHGLYEAHVSSNSSLDNDVMQRRCCQLLNYPTFEFDEPIMYNFPDLDKHKAMKSYADRLYRLKYD